MLDHAHSVEFGTLAEQEDESHYDTRWKKRRAANAGRSSSCRAGRGGGKGMPSFPQLNDDAENHDNHGWIGQFEDIEQQGDDDGEEENTQDDPSSSAAEEDCSSCYQGRIQFPSTDEKLYGRKMELFQLNRIYKTLLEEQQTQTDQPPQQEQPAATDQQPPPPTDETETAPSNTPTAAAAAAVATVNHQDHHRRRSQIVFLAGYSGTGKSTLVEYFIRQQEQEQLKQQQQQQPQQLTIKNHKVPYACFHSMTGKFAYTGGGGGDNSPPDSTVQHNHNNNNNNNHNNSNEPFSAMSQALNEFVLGLIAILEDHHHDPPPPPSFHPDDSTATIESSGDDHSHSHRDPNHTNTTMHIPITWIKAFVKRLAAHHDISLHSPDAVVLEQTVLPALPRLLRLVYQHRVSHNLHHQSPTQQQRLPKATTSATSRDVSLSEEGEDEEKTVVRSNQQPPQAATNSQSPSPQPPAQTRRHRKLPSLPSFPIHARKKSHGGGGGPVAAVVVEEDEDHPPHPPDCHSSSTISGTDGGGGGCDTNHGNNHNNNMAVIQYTVLNFLRAVVTTRTTTPTKRITTCPLIFFLDDCQWADTASLELLQALLLDPTLANICFILAYRPDEILRPSSSSSSPPPPSTTEESKHPFVEKILQPVQENRACGGVDGGDVNVEGVKSAGVDTKAGDDHFPEDDVTTPASAEHGDENPSSNNNNITTNGVHSMELFNLSPDCIVEYVADCINKDPDDDPQIAWVAKALYKKTLGNIFFVQQALEELVRRNALYYDTICFEWQFATLIQNASNNNTNTNDADRGDGNHNNNDGSSSNSNGENLSGGEEKNLLFSRRIDVFLETYLASPNVVAMVQAKLQALKPKILQTALVLAAYCSASSHIQYCSSNYGNEGDGDDGGDGFGSTMMAEIELPLLQALLWQTKQQFLPLETLDKLLRRASQEGLVLQNQQQKPMSSLASWSSFQQTSSLSSLPKIRKNGGSGAALATLAAGKGTTSSSSQQPQQYSTYQFAHDRIREAARASIPPGTERDQLLLSIAKVLLRRVRRQNNKVLSSNLVTSSTSQEEGIAALELSKIVGRGRPGGVGQRYDCMLFVAARHLNALPRELTQKDPEIGNLVSLNLKVGKMALSKGAFQEAVLFLRAGLNRLDPTTCWDDDRYAITLELYNTMAESENMLGNDDEALALVETIFQKAKTLQDKCRAHFCFIQAMNSKNDNNYAQSVDAALKILSLYNVDVPSAPTKGQIKREKMLLRLALRNRSLICLVKFPLATDILQIAQMKVAFYTMLYATFGKRTDLALFLGYRMLRVALTTNKSITKDIPSFLVTLGAHARETHRYKSAFLYSNTAVGLLDRFPSNEKQGKEFFLVKLNLFAALFSLRLHHRDCIESFLELHKWGYSHGETEHGLAAGMLAMFSFAAASLPLNALFEPKLILFQEMAERRNRKGFVVIFGMIRQYLYNLQGGAKASPIPSELNGAAWREEEALAMMEGPARKQNARDVSILRLQLAVIFNNTNAMVELLERLDEYPVHDHVIVRQHLRMTFTGFAALILLASASSSSTTTTNNKKDKHANISKLWCTNATTAESVTATNRRASAIVPTNRKTSAAATSSNRRASIASPNQKDIVVSANVNRREQRTSTAQKWAKIALSFFEELARFGSPNCQPVYACMKALQKLTTVAFDEAIQMCGNAGLLNLTAIMNEQYGLLLLKQGQQQEQPQQLEINNENHRPIPKTSTSTEAETYLKCAIWCYHDWGATGKVAQLKSQYDCLKNAMQEKAPSQLSSVRRRAMKLGIPRSGTTMSTTSD